MVLARVDCTQNPSRVGAVDGAALERGAAGCSAGPRSAIAPLEVSVNAK